MMGEDWDGREGWLRRKKLDRLCKNCGRRYEHHRDDESCERGSRNVTTTFAPYAEGERPWRRTSIWRDKSVMVLDDESASVLAAIEAGDTDRALREAKWLAQRIRDLIAEGKLPDSDQGFVNPDGTLDL